MGNHAGKRALRQLSTGLVLLALTLPAFAINASQKKQLARNQFEAAERAREELNGRPVEERTRRDYQRVTDMYRRVYYVAPTSSRADEAVVAVAELLAETGRRFNEPKTLQAAIGQFEFLRREYPGSKYRVDALFTIGQIYKEDLNDHEQAKATFQEFLKHYPHSHLSGDAHAAIAELEQPPDKKKKEPEPRESVTVTVPKNSPLPLVTGIRHWSTPDYTRVAIDLETEVQYQAGRVPNPDRIFFDLHETKLSSTLMGKTFDVQDGFLRKIRVAQYLKGITRLVLEVDDVSDYSAFLLPNPYRLIIDIHGRQARATKLAKNDTGKDKAETEDSAAEPVVEAAAKPQPAVTAPERGKVKPAETTVARNRAEPPLALATKVADGTTSPLKPHLDEITRPQTTRPTEVNGERADAKSKPAGTDKVAEARPSNPAVAPEPKTSGKETGSKARTAAVKTKAGDVAPAATKLPKAATDSERPRATETKAAPELADAKLSPVTGKTKKITDDDDLADSTTIARLDPPDLKTSKPTSAPTFESVAPRATLPKAKRRAGAEPAIHEAQPTSNGERSLIRALGLKIGKIVVDAGHGGHDTGTIGPGGLQEKDLVLDVALRLGRLLESKLGADVIYTRDDDTFVPLETRTAVANQNQADLFISIHANSSNDPSARGIETYYLNFTSSADALEVAARENAVSEKSIHELQDLVKKIALKEKIEESREFAAEVQKSLWTGVSVKSATVRNRGVKKAPFIVLIGANMPSILAEISFLSNPTDEKRLQTPEYRQKIAEYLYAGIRKYVSGLSGVKVAQKREPAR